MPLSKARRWTLPSRVFVFALTLLFWTTANAKRSDEWSKDDLQRFFGQLSSVSSAKGQAAAFILWRVLQGAYQERAKSGEAVDVSARRWVKKIEPGHPTVNEGQWIVALLRIFYLDAAQRAETLARFSGAGEKRYLLSLAAQARSSASGLDPLLQFRIPGLDEFSGLLPQAKRVKKRSERGTMVVVQKGAISVRSMERVRFVSHHPPLTTKRTSRGAIRSLVSPIKQANLAAKMFGQYDKIRKRGYGHLQVAMAKDHPAVYLNEIVRAAKESGVHTIHVLALDQAGELGEVAFRIRKRNKVCRNESPLARCLAHLGK